MQLSTGFVIIGRNEGERLQRCLFAACKECQQIVYVDSNSTDDSVAVAESLGVHVVALDTSKPFSAARARNEGFSRLIELYPSLDVVQFIDGDCELREGWLDAARSTMAASEQVAVVCGRRRERYPQRNTYHRLINSEWDTPIGVVHACGGDALVRVRPFVEVGGFNSSVIAGEEPEMCARLRARGYQILRIEQEMTYHDINMDRFRQWWKRSWRSGFGAADVAHRLGEQAGFNRQNRSAIIWGGAIPGFALAMLGLTAVFSLRWASGWLLLMIVLYVLQTLRIAKGLASSGLPLGHSLSGAWLLIAAKPAEFLGLLQYYWMGRNAASASAIEYK